MCRPAFSAADDAPPKRYAILVGVENYEHAKLREPNPLKYPVDDVSALAEILEKADYEVLLLTDDTGKQSPELLPTRSNIEARIKQVVEKCRRQDTILIALTGHGLQFTGNKDAYFCPIDARPFASETKTLVSVSGIYEELEKSFAGVKVILVDACRNDPDPGRGRGLDADSAPPPPKGVAALFSCSAGQRAFEHDEFQHGIFFHHVLEGMNGKAADQEGEVTFDSLSAYVRRAVPKSMQRTGGTVEWSSFCILWCATGFASASFGQHTKFTDCVPVARCLCTSSDEDGLMTVQFSHRIHQSIRGRCSKVPGDPGRARYTDEIGHWTI
jgi:uncharacterized caspase-like protein